MSAWTAGTTFKNVRVLGDFAYIRNHIELAMTPAGGDAPLRRSGFTLTILRRQADGPWVITRDANLLTVDQ